MDSYLVVLLVALGVMLFYTSLNRISGSLRTIADAYQVRTKWLAGQAEIRAKVALEKKQEKDKEREHRYWQALWEKLQQLQLEYLASESKGFDNVNNALQADRLAVRIALIWIDFLGLGRTFSTYLEGFPLGVGDENGDGAFLEYIERYARAAGVTPPSGYVRSRYQWLGKVRSMLDQKLRDLNTPVKQISTK